MHRQHRLKLLAKAALVEKELEEDRRLLEEIEKIQQVKEDADKKAQSDRLKEIQWMKKATLSYLAAHFPN